MEKVKMINYLKNSVLGDMVTQTNEETGEIESGIKLFDPEFNQTDEQLEEVLNLMTYKVGKGGVDLDAIPTELVHPLVLFAKRELYLKLAIKNSPLYDITSSTITLTKGQRFNHYYVLIQLLDAEINDLETSGALVFIQTGETLLDGVRYKSHRNYELSDIPAIELTIDGVHKDNVEISWTKFNTDGARKFSNYKVYISEKPIVDLYEDSPISIEPYKEITDIHRICTRISGLSPSTHYYVAISTTDVNSLTGYSQLEFYTKEE